MNEVHKYKTLRRNVIEGNPRSGELAITYHIEEESEEEENIDEQ